MSEPFRDALATALHEVKPTCSRSESHGPNARRHGEDADAIIAALPPVWRDYLAAREPLLALVAEIEIEAAYLDVQDRIMSGPMIAGRLRRWLTHPAIVKLREAGRG